MLENLQVDRMDSGRSRPHYHLSTDKVEQLYSVVKRKTVPCNIIMLQVSRMKRAGTPREMGI